MMRWEADTMPRQKPASTREFLKLLAAVGWSAEELARRSGYSAATVTNWCRGYDGTGQEYRPPPAIVEHLARHAEWLRKNRLPFRRVRPYVKRSAFWMIADKSVSSLAK
jgi:transcriptional regulator with XRE-family HTH domain